MEPRRGLSGLRGGAIDRRGDRAIAERLAHALDVVSDETNVELTHGFHSYPARFHPELPRRLLAATDGKRVLDPFVGSGTTLVEAALAGRRGHGVDANPLAVQLARLKASPWPAAMRARLLVEARQIAVRATEAAKAARRSGGRPTGRAPRFDDPKLYPPHIYPELVTLRQAIGAVSDGPIRGALLLVLSSIVVKVSLQRSDTDERIVERSIPRGAASRNFAARAEELVERMAAFAARVPPGTPPVEVREGDARKLSHIEARSIDLVITSPPYLGTYDYSRHHLRRFGWLGLDGKKLEAREIGSRRRATLDSWRHDVEGYVSELARVLSPAGWAYVLVGDSVLGERAVPGDEALRAAAAKSGLTVVASASQERPDIYAPGTHARGRREHLVALRPPR